MDYKLLDELFKVPTTSNDEDKMIMFVCNKLEEIGVSYDIDDNFNIYGFNHKGAPLLSAHLDTVQGIQDLKLLDFIKVRNNILSGYGIIGGDDKCGVYIILKLLEEGEKINFLFPVQEEIGGIGSQNFVNERSDKIKDFCTYGIVLDRRGNSDILCYRDSYGVQSFSNFLEAIGEGFGYSGNVGLFSDADNLSDVISCTNLSVGYYNPHTEFEYVNLNDLKKSMNFTHAIIKNITEKFPAPKKNNHTTFHHAYIDSLKDDGSTGFDEFFDGMEDFVNTEFETVDYKECEFCGTGGFNHRYLESLNTFVCQACYKKLFDEIVFSDMV